MPKVMKMTWVQFCNLPTQTDVNQQMEIPYKCNRNGLWTIVGHKENPEGMFIETYKTMKGKSVEVFTGSTNTKNQRKRKRKK
jgi:hypothetical protein